VADHDSFLSIMLQFGAVFVTVNNAILRAKRAE
jgi:hypothetical protein